MTLKPNELAYLGNNPGAVKHGNFINYYSFHSVNSRMEHLDQEMFPKLETNSIVVLDVGCNSGELTSSLYNYLCRRYEDCTVNILAIDLDPILISRARETYNLLSTIEFEIGNIMGDEGRNIVKQYLEKHQRKCFDFTFCFSVTMWIHLNNGDEGLLDFLKYIQSISTSLIIEPQIWKCYKAAQKRLKSGGSLFENYNSLKIRAKVDSVIENAILEQGKFVKVSETIARWDRKVQCYRSKNDLVFGLSV